MMSLPALNYDLDPRRVGAGILVAGSITTALSIAAIIVDTTLLERRRQRQRVHVGADVSASQASLSISGRF
ncbi:hypothetical protein DB30_02119 [Enhygromyxa salina]|nr:hypothetical protein [Enhygromyxa salina]KIG12001.1 hypothetical protein DB30_02119 [Enhygromyxa salina]